MAKKDKIFTHVLGGTITGSAGISGNNLAHRSWEAQEDEQVVGVMASVVINNSASTSGMSGYYFNLSQSGEWLGPGSLGFYKAMAYKGATEGSITTCHVFQNFANMPIDVLEGEQLYLHFSYLAPSANDDNCDYDFVIFYKHKS